MSQTVRIVSAMRTIGLTGLILAASVAMAEGQSRNLSDPGRVFRSSSMRAASMKVAGAKDKYHLFATPAVSWTEGSEMYGGQLRYQSDNLVSGTPIAISGMVSNFHANGTNKSNLQLDAEIDPYVNGRFSLNLSGQMSHMMDVSTSMQLAPALDITVNEFVTIAPIMYWNHFKVAGSTLTTSGMTFGVTAYLTRGTWAAYPEYDFKSDFAVEDRYSVKVLKSFANMKRGPMIFVGYAKDDIFSAGMRLTLK